MRGSLLCVGILLTASRAAAEGAPEPPVHLDLASCPNAPAAQVKTIVGVELHTTIVEDASRAAVRVEVQCAGEHVDVTVRSAAAYMARGYDMPFAGPRVYGRTLAIAIAELVSAVEAGESDGATVVPQRVSLRPTPAEAVRATSRWALGLLGAATSTTDMAFLGPRLTLARRFRGPFGLELAAGYGRGQRDAELGQVRLNLAELAFSAFGRVVTGAFEWRFGATVRGAMAWLDGRSTRSDVETASFSTPLLVTAAQLGGRYTFTDDWHVELALEPGWMVHGARAGVDQGSLRVGGLALGGALGVSRSF